jgi:hypothetical protein
MAKRSSATGWAGFVMLAAAAVVMLIPSSAAAAQVVSCGAAIVQDTKLDHDLDCPDTALTISADGVTLDLAGHEITGHGQGVGVVNLKWQAFELRRGQMAGFEAGALLGSLTATAPRRGQRLPRRPHGVRGQPRGRARRAGQRRRGPARDHDWERRYRRQPDRQQQPGRARQGQRQRRQASASPWPSTCRR